MQWTKFSTNYKARLSWSIPLNKPWHPSLGSWLFWHWLQSWGHHQPRVAWRSLTSPVPGCWVCAASDAECPLTAGAVSPLSLNDGSSSAIIVAVKGLSTNDAYSTGGQSSYITKRNSEKLSWEVKLGFQCFSGLESYFQSPNNAASLLAQQVPANWFKFQWTHLQKLLVFQEGHLHWATVTVVNHYGRSRLTTNLQFQQQSPQSGRFRQHSEMPHKVAQQLPIKFPSACNLHLI